MRMPHESLLTNHKRNTDYAPETNLNLTNETLMTHHEMSMKHRSNTSRTRSLNTHHDHNETQLTHLMKITHHKQKCGPRKHAPDN